MAAADLRQRVSDTLTALWAFADVGGERDHPDARNEAMGDTMHALRHEGQPLLLPRPTRGAGHQLAMVLPQLKRHPDLMGLTHDDVCRVAPRDGAEERRHKRVEWWREAEALALAPHTMAALRQLPELRQVIAHTAAQAVLAAGAPVAHAQVLAQAGKTLDPLRPLSLGQFDAAVPEPQRKEHTGAMHRLFDRLCPQLRLALAADVAAGMLCPGPEHAAALEYLVGLAGLQLADELNVQQQQQDDLVSAAPPPGELVRARWLAPQVDLALHVPPAQLLQFVAQQHRAQPDRRAPALGLLVDGLREGLGVLAYMQGLAGANADASAGGASKPAAPDGICPVEQDASSRDQLGAQAQEQQQQQQGIRARCAELVRQEAAANPHGPGVLASWAAEGLVARFITEAGELGPQGAAGRHQAQVALQVLALLSAAQQLRAAVGRAQEAAAASDAAQPAQQVLLQKVLAFVKMVRDFKALNAAEQQQQQQQQQQQHDQQQQQQQHDLQQQEQQQQQQQQHGWPPSSEDAASGVATPPAAAFGADGLLSGLVGGEGDGAGFWSQLAGPAVPGAAPAQPQAGAGGPRAKAANSGSGGGGGSSSSSSSSCSCGTAAVAPSRQDGPCPGLHGAQGSLLASLSGSLRLVHKVEAAAGAVLSRMAAQARAEDWHGTLPATFSSSLLSTYPLPHLKQWHAQLQDDLEGCRLLPEPLGQLGRGLTPEQLGVQLTNGALCAGLLVHMSLYGACHALQLPQLAEAVHQHALQRMGLQPLSDSVRLRAIGCEVAGLVLPHEPAPGDPDAWGRAAEQFRSLAESLAARLGPYVQWYRHHNLRRCNAFTHATLWWLGQRSTVAAAGATGKCLPPAPGGVFNSAAAAADSSQPGSTLPAPPHQQQHQQEQERRRQQQQQQQQEEVPVAGSQPSEQSSPAGSWQHGRHDWCQNCPLCRSEQQQQKQQREQQQAAAGASSSANSGSGAPSSPWPVAYDDPYMWRRLLWVLLGKLSPEAQAFFAKYLAMCPHCPKTDMWLNVLESVQRALWTPPTSDQHQSAHYCMVNGILGPTAAATLDRGLHQWARAANLAFAQSYHPSTTLLAKQVLLALSPLHHQVLPPPVVAPFLPSSFAPSIGKALMDSLFEGPVLDGYAHEACQVQPWHVWWHVGLRRYAALKRRQQQEQEQQQQQQQALAAQQAQTQRQQRGKQRLRQAGGAAGGRSAGNAGSVGSAAGSLACAAAGVDLEGLYLDHDARLYAVGFATRQLSGTPAEQTSAAACADGLAERARTVMQAVQEQALQCALLDEVIIPACSAGRLPASYCERGSRDCGLMVSAVCACAGSLCRRADVAAVGSELLAAAACWPRDPLVPPDQQRPLSARPAPGYQHPLQQLALLYVTCMVPGPGGGGVLCVKQALQQSAAGPGRAQGATQPQQQQPQEQRPSDVSRLALLQPVPAAALGDPAAWCMTEGWLRSWDACDMCGACPEGTAMQQCVANGPGGAILCGAWCSEACRAQDAGHKLVCAALRQAALVFAGPRGPHVPGGALAQGPGCSCSSCRRGPMAGARGPAFPALAGLLRSPFREPGCLGPFCQDMGIPRAAWPHGNSLAPVGDVAEAIA